MFVRKLILFDLKDWLSLSLFFYFFKEHVFFASLVLKDAFFHEMSYWKVVVVTLLVFKSP